MTRNLLTAVALAVLAGCSSNSPTAPGGGGTPGGGTNGGGTTGGGPAPATAAVSVGNNVFRSARNATANPAVDTVAVGGTVTWTWAGTGGVPHSVQSLGAPGFTSSAVLTGEGSTYQVTFATAGKYQYDCAVHGTAMSGTIVVR